jgi:hypothetical protein
MFENKGAYCALQEKREIISIFSAKVRDTLMHLCVFRSDFVGLLLKNLSF